MARKSNQRKKQRALKRKGIKELRDRLKTARMQGFTPVTDDNPFANTSLMKKTKEENLKRIQRRFNSDVKRRNTFATKANLKVTKGYDTIVNILGNPLYHVLKATEQLDSTQVIDLVKKFDEDVPPEVLEHALLTYIQDLTLPSYVEIESIQEALDAGFTIEEATEYAELMVKDLPPSGVSFESTYVDIYDILKEDLNIVARNNGKV